jgi:hypothetical protein
MFRGFLRSVIFKARSSKFTSARISLNKLSVQIVKDSFELFLK